MAQQIAGNSATSAAAQVGLLLDAGAGLVVVPNVPDISATPELLEAVITAGLGAAAPPALKAALEALAEELRPISPVGNRRSARRCWRRLQR